MRRIISLACWWVIVLAVHGGMVFGAEDEEEGVTGSVQERSLAAKVEEVRDMTRAEVMEFYAGEEGLEYSEWADQTTDNRVWKEMAKAKMYAVRSEGRLHEGELQYRKGYRNLEQLYPGRKKLERYTYTGMGHEVFIKRNRELFARGYTLMWLQSFADSTGVVYYQGLWAKVMETSSGTVEVK